VTKYFLRLAFVEVFRYSSQLAFMLISPILAIRFPTPHQAVILGDVILMVGSLATVCWECCQCSPTDESFQTMQPHGSATAVLSIAFAHLVGYVLIVCAKLWPSREVDKSDKN